MNIKELIKLILSYMVKLLPLSWFKWLVQSNLSPNLRNLFRLGLRDRDVIISEGLATGLKFNAGKTNPDAVHRLVEQQEIEPPKFVTLYDG
jgi:hypothetical protein